MENYNFVNRKKRDIDYKNREERSVVSGDTYKYYGDEEEGILFARS